MEAFTFIKIGLEGQEDILYGYEYVSSHTLLVGLIRRFQISPLRTPPQRICRLPRYHLWPHSKRGNVVIESLSLLSLAGIFSLPDRRPKSTNKGRFVNINYFYHLGIFLWLNTI